MDRRTLLQLGLSAIGLSASDSLYADGLAIVDCPDSAQFTISDICEILSCNPEIYRIRPEVACFYYPSWYLDNTRNKVANFPSGFTEWDRLKSAKKIYKCKMPASPLWGSFDPADPTWAAKEIDLAADSGINAFIWDWYHYNGNTSLHAPLDLGFLKAHNKERLQFGLMWIAGNDLQYRMDPESIDFEDIIQTAVEKYFSCVNYWKLRGEPAFGIYGIKKLLAWFGKEGLAKRIKRIREKAARLGVPKLFLYTCWEWFEPNAELVQLLGFDGITMYNTLVMGHLGIDNLSNISFKQAAIDSVNIWQKFADKSGCLFFPDCAVGWDNSSRIGAKAKVVLNRSPRQFELLLRAARWFVDERKTQPSVVFLSSWNEWTEDHFLLPDQEFGGKYLDAVASVFKT